MVEASLILSVTALILATFSLLCDLGSSYVQRFPDQADYEGDSGDVFQRVWRCFSGAHPRVARLLWLGLMVLAMGVLGWLGSVVVAGAAQFRFVDDSNVVFQRWGPGWLVEDPLPASTIASNNLAPDAGGISAMGEHVIAVDLVPNLLPAKSEGPPTWTGDVLLVFRTTSSTSTGERLTHLSHFDGSSFSPPTRLRAPDMDPSQPIRILGR